MQGHQRGGTGIETELRIGNAVCPNHYDVGWHITGAAGVFGAAAAAGKLPGLTEQQMVWALGLAAAQPVGLRESFGSMCESFNPGRGASNGIFAALPASKNCTGSDGMIEAKRGWANAISTRRRRRTPVQRPRRARPAGSHDPAIKPEQVDMTITLVDGRQLHKYIAHAIGSLEVPMSDKQLEPNSSTWPTASCRRRRRKG